MSEEKKEEVTTSYHSYPKLFAVGHSAVRDIFLDAVLVEEKIDGSQISFGVFPGNESFEGGLRVRSKGSHLNLVAPEKMFQAGVDVLKEISHLLTPGWTYRGEYVAKPKHNTLAYGRTPKNLIIGFDINTGHEQFMSYAEKVEEFNRIGLETVPMLYHGMVEDMTMFRALLAHQSCLGAQKVEGIVIKNYARFGIDGHVKMAKFVSEEFKEVHTGTWRDANPLQNDIVEQLIAAYKTPARWAKAVQHLKEAGQLKESPEDIGFLLKEISKDTHTECMEEIKEKLFNWAWPKVSRGLTRGFPEWYKEELVKLSFEE